MSVGEPSRLDVAFVVPRSGPAGIFGPSCEACGQLAAEEINEADGVLGRELRLHAIDGGRAPEQVAAEVDALVGAGLVDAVAGWHISAVRQRLTPIVAGRVPYVYSPGYEGGERTPGVFLTGETPDRQLLPALRWMAGELDVRTWFVIGNDYVWPQQSARAVRRYARDGTELRIVDEMFVPLGTTDFGPVVQRVARSNAHGVLMLLVGSDAVQFNRAFAAESGLDRLCVRLSPLIDENVLLASGVPSGQGLYSAAGYFETLVSRNGLDFSGRYSECFGPRAPMLNSLGESCYEGITLLARLAARARSVELRALGAAAEGIAYESPRGRVRMTDNHLDQSVYLAKADGLQFDVLAELAGVGG
ncbi:MAG TPA: substrate-binding domain-containing protein [Pseudonocardia sp.]|nr:substrate-binding domain-containing protein [Pseudonocardia sp.]